MDERRCFECCETIRNIAEAMSWGTRGGTYHTWFHIMCFNAYVDRKVIGDIEYFAEMERRAGQSSN